MLSLLKERGLNPEGVKKLKILRLVGREGTNVKYQPQEEFTLAFEQLSPHMLIEILQLPEAQQMRYLAAYEIAKTVLRELKLFPINDEDEKAVIELDEMETGYPKLTLQQIYDIVNACAHLVGRKDGLPYFEDPDFYKQRAKVMEVIGRQDLPSHPLSWFGLKGKLGKLKKLKIFDNKDAVVPDYESITSPGTVTIVDLSDTESPQIRNLALAELLRGLQIQQDLNYESAQKSKREVQRVMVIIEEAHEFLSRARIQQMPVLFQQVDRIAKRGRKRWLSLVFVTQLPQHLPDELFGLVNSFIFHKISDGNVISNLKRSIGQIDEGLWRRMTTLSQGQAIVRIEGFTRPLMVTIDPNPAKLRMTD